MNSKLRLLIVATLLAVSQGFAQDSSGVTCVSSIAHDWGEITDIAVQGETALLATRYSGLRLVNFSNPEAPKETGFWNTERGSSLRSVAVKEDIAVAAEFSVVRIIDVSDPENPDLLSSFEHQNIRELSGIALAGSFAFIAAADSGLLVLDLSDPGQPSLHNRIQLPGSVEAVVYDRNYLYIGSGDTLRLFDASDPGNIIQEAVVRTNDDIQNITVVGNLIYLSFGNSAMSAYDLSFPNRLHLVGSVQWLWAKDVAATGNFGYAVQATEITIVEIQRLNEVTVHRDYELPLAPRCAAMAGDLLLVGEQSVGLLVIDVSDRMNPLLVGHRFSAPSDPTGLALSDYLYIADRDGMLIVDTENPAEPEKLSFSFSISPHRVYDVAVDGDYVFMACGNAGVKVLDKSDPAHPREVGDFLRYMPAQNIVIQDNYAYLYGSGVIAAFDINNPEALISAGSIDLEMDIADVEIAGHVAVVSGREDGLHFIDFSNPAEPRRIGMIQTSDAAKDAAILNNLAFVAAGDSGIRVVNFADPTHPVEVGSFTEGLRFASNIAVEDSVAFLADDWAGLRIINFRDLEHPFEMGHYHQQFNQFLSTEIIVSNGIVYISKQSTVEIYDCNEALGISSEPVKAPGSFLISNYPNPFNSSTTISYSLPRPAMVSLSVYNPAGQLLTEEAPGYRTAGSYNYILNAAGLPGGTYFIRLQAGELLMDRQVTLVR